MLSAVGVVAFLETQTQKAERDFINRAININSHFVELHHGIESVLEGFSAMLEAMNSQDVSNQLMLTQFASRMQQIYPLVYSLEQVEAVPRDQVTAFEERQSRAQGAAFLVHGFDYGPARAKVPPSDKADYYVITFVKPMREGSSQVLGMDIESSRAQSTALRKALLTGHCATSPPYASVSGPWAYMMIRPVGVSLKRFAKVLVRADTLAESSWLAEEKDLSISIHHEDYTAADPRGLLYSHAEAPADRLETMLLPVFQWQNESSVNSDLPFVVDVTKQMRWRDLDLPVLIGVLSVQLAVMALLLKMTREHYFHDRERHEHELRLAYLASHDSLTGLPNRALLLDRLEQGILRAKRSSSKLALLFLDVDRFKSVNDTYGHDAGDRLLMILADTMRESVRAQDTVARLSGDEFVVLLERVERREEVDRIARKIRDNLRSSTCKGYRQLGVGISLGIAMYPENGTGADALMRYADTQMYSVKRGGTPPALMF